MVVVDDSTTLVGALMRPASSAPAAAVEPRVPGVLLIGGSGPQDRDGTRVELSGYAPWRELSESLAAAGMAVLRLDDRGTGESGGRFAGATTDDFARRYSQPTAPSRVFCELKLKNILTQIETIQHTNARRPR